MQGSEWIIVLLGLLVFAAIVYGIFAIIRAGVRSGVTQANERQQPPTT